MPRKFSPPAPVIVSIRQDLVKKGLRLLRDADAEGISKEALAKGLGDGGEPVSNKTVERLMKTLRGDGAEISDSRRGLERTKRFVLKTGPSWDNHVSAEARLAFELACMILNQSGTLLWQEKIRAIQDLVASESHVSRRDRELFDQLKGAVKVFGGVEDPKESNTVLEPLLRAFQGGHVVSLEYQAAGKSMPITMEVFPCALTHDLFSGGAFLLVWDSVKHIPKQLRLNRIAEVKVIKRRGVVTHPERLERALRYQIGSWVSADEPFEVKVRITGKNWVQALDDAPPALPDFVGRKARNGASMIATFKANAKEGVLRWVLQFGRCAEIIHPQLLRDEIQEELRKNLAAYDA